MTTNLEKLRKMKSNNLKKEADLSTSFSIDEGTSIPEDNTGKTEPVDLKVNHVSEEKKPANSTQKTEEKTPEKKSEPSSPINNIKPIKPSKPIKEINNSSSSEKNMGLRLQTQEDLDYLNLAPLGRAMTKKAFFIQLMEDANANSQNADLTDETVRSFRNAPLKTTQVTIAVPEELINSIKQSAANYLMKPQRYMAYVIHKARVSDSSWKNI